MTIRRAYKHERCEKSEREIEFACECLGGALGAVVLTMPIWMILLGII